MPGVLLDITQRKAAELALAGERHKLETIFQKSRRRWRCGAATNWFSAWPIPSTKLSSGAIFSASPWPEAIPELHGQAFDDLLRGVLHSGKPVVSHETIVRTRTRPDKSPENRYYDYTYARIDDNNGEPYGVYDHAIDVTERVRPRQKLEESEDACASLCAAARWVCFRCCCRRSS